MIWIVALRGVKIPREENARLELQERLRGIFVAGRFGSHTSICSLSLPP